MGVHGRGDHPADVVHAHVGTHEDALFAGRPHQPEGLPALGFAPPGQHDLAPAAAPALSCPAAD